MRIVMRVIIYTRGTPETEPLAVTVEGGANSVCTGSPLSMHYKALVMLVCNVRGRRSLRVQLCASFCRWNGLYCF